MAGTKRSGTKEQHRFSQIPAAEIQRSKFNRSSGLKTAFFAGDLVPIFVDEALPGDTFHLKTTLFGRLATPIHPVMENMYLDVFYFAVPIRLLWENWQKFNGEQASPGDSTDFLVPQVTIGAQGFQEGSVMDHMGLPIGVSDLSVCAFWPRAYNLIWNEWFRDENLQDPAETRITDGPDAEGIYPLRKRGKRHGHPRTPAAANADRDS